ncbi:MAG: LysM peptidoglycan-binding domain-containing protein [Verrucomicrobia bacterium]|nr:LysM peptidoglycan-binding domain-containing protein [Verrucomicrobiota bacterium]
MTVTPRIRDSLLVVLCSMMLSGCFPSQRAQMNEEKEPHFLSGRSLVNAMDYPGAIKAFGKALEVNPRSGAAHFELGWLYAEKVGDPASAIYHYQRYLELRPGAENAETVGQHVFRLKQELAKAVLPMPSTPGIQRDFEQLAAENRRLQEELQTLRAAYAILKANAQSSGSDPISQRSATLQESRATTPASPTTSQAAVPGHASAASMQATRTHKVQSGETPYSIARRYGVKVNALLSANPGLNPQRMQVGQVLNVPAS